MSTRDVPWMPSQTEPGRVPPRECIRAARDALNKAYGYTEAPWPLIAEAVDWQRRALEQMVPPASTTAPTDGMPTAETWPEHKQARRSGSTR